MDWIFIGVGAGVGSVLRYEIGHRMALEKSALKTLGTFVVNLVGAFLLGLVVALSIDGLWWNLLADGFLGGFTTFSTFMVEGVQLVRGNQKLNALGYFVTTVVLGIGAFLLGDTVGLWISA